MFTGVALGCLALGAPCRAQLGATSRVRVRDSADMKSIDAGPLSTPIRWRLVAAGGLALAGATDARLSAFLRGHQRPALDRVAATADPFGRAGILVPVLAGSVLVTKLAMPSRVADATIRVALVYAAADGVESVLKPVIGRHRPSDGRGPWRFRPLSGDADWHSAPSAHTVHAFALATGLALESRRSWVAVPAYTVATLVGMQRVYTGAHWGSDVVASAALAVATAGATDRLLRRRGLAGVFRPVDSDTAPSSRAPEAPPSRVYLAGTAGRIVVGWVF